MTEVTAATIQAEINTSILRSVGAHSETLEALTRLFSALDDRVSALEAASSKQRKGWRW